MTNFDNENNFVLQFENIIEQHGTLSIIRHKENGYKDIIVPTLENSQTSLITTSQFKKLFDLGPETENKSTFLLFRKYIPQGFKIKENDLLMIIDKKQFTQNKIQVLQKYEITTISTGIIYGNLEYLRLHCNKYRFQ